MQPYFLPYIGYWQLLNAVDKFIVYDNIQYTKKGWINRNHFLQNGKSSLFTIPLKKDSSSLNIQQRTIANSYNRIKIARQFKSAYHQAPFFSDALPTIEKIIHSDEENLYHYLLTSIKHICTYLKIDTSKIVTSSHISIDHSLKSEKKVLSLCHELGANEYYNPIGGIELYDKEHFATQHINLQFLKTQSIQYQQFNNKFVPWLSIVDIMMFNSVEAIQEMLTRYALK